MILVRVGELARQLGVHRNTIRNWIKRGKLTARPAPGKGYYVSEQEFVELCRRYGLDPRGMSLRRVEGAHEGGGVVGEGGVGEGARALVVGRRGGKGGLEPQWVDVCLTCGSCASACPISGVDGLDPRKVVRMVVLGMAEQVVASSWPWKCTLCGKCEEACPMDIAIVELMRRARALRPREAVPKPMDEGVQMCLATGNNMGIPTEDFVMLLRALGDELASEGLSGFEVPVDRRGARVMVTINSKLVFSEPETLKFWWRIFYAAGEDWSIPSVNWEGVNWGWFTGDEQATRRIVGRMVENMRRLGCKSLLLPECGHAYYATRLGLRKWFADEARDFEVITMFELLVRYIAEGRIRLDPSRHPLPATFHDSCHYGRLSLRSFGHGYFEEGRWIVKQCCPRFVEMYPNRAGNYCCGAGGGAWAMNYHAERVFAGRLKARQIKASGAKVVVTACHNCRDQIAKSLAREYDLDIQVKYLWELVAEALVI